MDRVVSDAGLDRATQRQELLALYDDALADVYGYLVSRCGSIAVAEDLTAETFLAAVDAVERGTVADLRTAWLVGVARNKLVDHWRRQERERRAFSVVADDPLADESIDDWDVRIDAGLATDTLASLGAHHRSALTLRYLDGLPVAEVAEVLGRTVGATEVLLVRAKAAFRRQYEEVAS